MLKLSFLLIVTIDGIILVEIRVRRRKKFGTVAVTDVVVAVAAAVVAALLLLRCWRCVRRWQRNLLVVVLLLLQLLRPPPLLLLLLQLLLSHYDARQPQFLTRPPVGQYVHRRGFRFPAGAGPPNKERRRFIHHSAAAVVEIVAFDRVIVPLAVPFRRSGQPHLGIVVAAFVVTLVVVFEWCYRRLAQPISMIEIVWDFHVTNRRNRGCLG